MVRFFIILGAMAWLSIGKVMAQNEGFITRVDKISDKIVLISQEEKAALKEEVATVNARAQRGEITWEEAENIKLALAESRAKNIERRTQAAKAELEKSIQELVDGSIEKSGVNDSIVLAKSKTKGGYNLIVDIKSDSVHKQRSEARTTSQLVVAYGANYWLADGDFQSDKYRDFTKGKSTFFELGTTWKTRLSKESALTNLKYGFSIQYNQMAPKSQNGMFVSDGTVTYVEETEHRFKKSFIRNVNLVFPVHFEMDFSPKKEIDGESVIHSHQSVRLGVGGYAGFNVKSKVKTKYEDELGNTVKTMIKNDYNAESFVYGLSAYVGYGSVSLYAKYDLNSVFKDNPIEENNLSIGLRLDLN